jgi:hypothetical protein
VKRLLQLLALTALAAAQAWAMSAEFVGAGTPRDLRWRSPVIRLAVSTSITSQNASIKADSDVLGALRRSVAQWEAVTGLQFRIESTDGQNVSAAGSAGDGVSLITIAPTQENMQLFAGDPFGESARTRVFYNRRGAITEGDIVLNPLQQFSTDGTYGTFDLETTFSHEIGHLLGLRHSAVAGSIMAERIPRNGDIYAGPRTPTETDIAAIRDLYAIETGSCCGIVAGKLGIQARTSKGVTVWVEDGQGRVTGQVEAGADGTYRIGGLADGKYQLFWLGRDANGMSTGELGSATVEAGSQIALSKHVVAEPSDLSIEYIGLNLQPGDAAVTLRAGRQYNICLAGHGFSSGLASVSFSSKLIHADQSSLARQDLGNKVDAMTVGITVDPDTRPGVYTLYAERRDGARAAIVGAVLVTK